MMAIARPRANRRPGEDRVVLPEVPAQVHAHDLAMGAAEALDDLPASVRRTIVDQDDLVADRQRLQGGRDRRDQGLQAFRAAVDGDDDRELWLRAGAASTRAVRMIMALLPPWLRRRPRTNTRIPWTCRAVVKKRRDQIHDPVLLRIRDLGERRQPQAAGRSDPR